MPRIFEIFNDAVMYGDVPYARATFQYELLDLDACNECGACVCGKKIDIPATLKKARALLKGE